jgi:hypothetical protein
MMVLQDLCTRKNGGRSELAMMTVKGKNRGKVATAYREQIEPVRGSDKMLGHQSYRR